MHDITKLSFSFSTNIVDAKSHQQTQNETVGVFELQRIKIDGIGKNPSFDLLPDLVRKRYNDGDLTAGDQYGEYKKLQSWFIPGGICEKHHNNKTLVYNGCGQIDVDFKTKDGDKIAKRIFDAICKLRPAGVISADYSPGTFGIKILFWTTNKDVTRHADTFRKASAQLAELLQIDIKCFDFLGASQPCFTPYERKKGTTFFNPLATPVHIELPVLALPEITWNEDSDKLRTAAKFIIDSPQTFNVSDRSEFLAIMKCCKSLFSDGETIGWQILARCIQWEDSNTKRTWSNQWRGIKSNPQETGLLLLKLANKLGFARFEADQQKAKNQAHFEKLKKARQEREKQKPTDKNNLVALPGEYLTDTLRRHGMSPADIIGKFVVAGTGSGKTHTVAQILAEDPQRKIILVVPTIAVVNDQCARNPDARRFVGGNRTVQKDDRFFICCCQSFPALATRINLREFDVFFDESHGLVSDAHRGYKLSALRRFYHVARDLAKSLTFLTGTDLKNFHPDFKKIERLVVRSKSPIKKTAHLVDAKHVLSAAVSKFEESIKAGRFPVLLLNDKSAKLAEVKFLLQGYTLAVLNSETKESEFFKTISTKGAVPDGVQGIVTTVVLREGNSLFDDRLFDFIIVGTHHSSTIEQLSARIRNAKEIHVHIIRHADRKTNESTFNPDKYAQLVERRAQYFIDEQNNQEPGDDTALLFFERELRKAIQYQPVAEDKDGRLQICFFALNNEVHHAETQHEYQNDAYLKNALQQYGFEVDTPSDILQDQPDATLQAGISKARNEAKEERQSQHRRDLDTLKKAVNPMGVIQAAERANQVPKCYKFTKTLVDKFGIEIKKAIELLAEVDTPKKFALLERQIFAYCLRSNPDYMKNGRIFSLILRKIYKEIQPGAYTADDLRIKLAHCLQLDKSLNLEFLLPADHGKESITTANRKAVSVLRVFFAIEETGKQKQENWYRKRVLFIHSFSTTFNKQLFDKQAVNEKNTIAKTNVEHLESAILEQCPF